MEERWAGWGPPAPLSARMLCLEGRFAFSGIPGCSTDAQVTNSPPSAPGRHHAPRAGPRRGDLRGLRLGRSLPRCLAWGASCPSRWALVTDNGFLAWAGHTRAALSVTPPPPQAAWSPARVARTPVTRLPGRGWDLLDLLPTALPPYPCPSSGWADGQFAVSRLSVWGPPARRG